MDNRPEMSFRLHIQEDVFAYDLRACNLRRARLPVIAPVRSGPTESANTFCPSRSPGDSRPISNINKQEAEWVRDSLIEESFPGSQGDR